MKFAEPLSMEFCEMNSVKEGRTVLEVGISIVNKLWKLVILSHL